MFLYAYVVKGINRIHTVEECDATLMKRITEAGHKK